MLTREQLLEQRILQHLNDLKHSSSVFHDKPPSELLELIIDTCNVLSEDAKRLLTVRRSKNGVAL
jgi:hypothetical protein